jgi:hypothetical protein
MPGAARAIAIASAVATLGFMAWVADWSMQPTILAFMIGLLAWCVSPYALIAFVARTPRASASSAIALLATALAVAGFAAVVYVDAFFIHLDAQGGLVFLFVPVVQWMGTAVGIVATHLLDRRAATT